MTKISHVWKRVHKTPILITTDHRPYWPCWSYFILKRTTFEIRSNHWTFNKPQTGPDTGSILVALDQQSIIQIHIRCNRHHVSLRMRERINDYTILCTAYNTSQTTRRDCDMVVMCYDGMHPPERKLRAHILFSNA